ncbi:MAG: hypothetical protein J6U59_05115, partial [Alistipes sp.]|nr:hypothetical protein [Alistipes sp.]
MKKILNLLVALPLLFVACNTPSDGPVDTPKEPKLELLSESLVQVGSEAGEYTILYSIEKENEAIGGNTGITNNTSPITSSTDASWITIENDRSIYGELLFSVEENESIKVRSGTITLSYSSCSVEVSVKQEAAKRDEPTGVKGWSVVGSMTNNWDVDSAIAMEEIDGYYVARGVEVAATDSFKFAKDGTLQNSLGGNGQAAERDYKYPASKYGSDIRVKEAGTYDLYINEALDTYYVMSEGKLPSEANEVIAQGEDVWYVTGLGETQRMRKSGIFQSITSVELD